HVDGAILWIEADVAARQGAVRAGRCAVQLDAAQMRADTRDQLARAEGLDDVVVSAHVEPGDTVGFLAARGEEQDRRGESLLLAQAAADVDAVAAWQHDVEHDRVRWRVRAQRRLPRLVRGRGGHHTEALAAQVAFDHFDDDWLIVGNEDGWFRLAQPCCTPGFGHVSATFYSRP